MNIILLISLFWIPIGSFMVGWWICKWWNQEKTCYYCGHYLGCYNKNCKSNTPK